MPTAQSCTGYTASSRLCVPMASCFQATIGKEQAQPPRTVTGASFPSLHTCKSSNILSVVVCNYFFLPPNTSCFIEDVLRTQGLRMLLSKFGKKASFYLPQRRSTFSIFSAIPGHLWDCVFEGAVLRIHDGRILISSCWSLHKRICSFKWRVSLD